MDQATCPQCHLQVLPIFYFCPNCGKVLRKKPLSTSIGKQLGIYFLSFFIPPLGLVPGFKYLFQKGARSKVVGLIVLFLTFISIVLTIQLTLGLTERIKQQINAQLSGQLNNQLNNQIRNIQPQ